MNCKIEKLFKRCSISVEILNKTKIMNRVSLYIILVLFLFSACQTSQKRTSDASVAYRSPIMDRAETVEKFTDKKSQFKQEERIVLYNAFVDLKVEEEKIVQDQVTTLAKKYEGYILYSNNSEVRIRVLSDKLNIALEEIGNFGKVVRQEINGEDVTEEYTDMTIRLENAERTRQRYLALLDQAVNVSEVLMVERELERLNRELELLKGRLQRLDELHTFSTITVYYQKKVKPGVLGYVFVGLWKGIKFLFVRS